MQSTYIELVPNLTTAILFQNAKIYSFHHLSSTKNDPRISKCINIHRLKYWNTAKHKENKSPKIKIQNTNNFQNKLLFNRSNTFFITHITHPIPNHTSQYLQNFCCILESFRDIVNILFHVLDLFSFFKFSCTRWC